MSSTRRSFLAGVAGAGLSLGWPEGRARSMSPAAMNAARRNAATRRRRVIFNNDGDDIWAPGADSAERFLAVRHAPLIGTHVDSVFYCTTQSFSFFSHQSKVAEVFLSKQGPFAGNNLPGFLEQNTDGLRMSGEFARQHGLESIWTLRMNDVHDAWTAPLRPKWKRDDPSRVMSTLEKTKDFHDRRRLWSLVDFEHPDVQPRLLAVIEEVLTGYEIDGVELDFMRAPCYFRSTWEGRSVTDTQVGILTTLVRAVRQLVLRLSEIQGRALLLTVRVPSTVALCQKIGIDIQSWLQEKLIDVMALGGGYITFDLPAKELINLGHQHDVPVYPCISRSGLLYRPPRGESTPQPAEAWFGAASRLWHDGADGIYTFNLFPGPGDDEQRTYARRILSTIGSATKLAEESVMFGISDAGWWMPSHYWAKDAADFSQALPMSLKPNEYQRTWMEIPEDLRGAGFHVTAELRVDFTGLSEDSEPEILFGSANFGPVKNGKTIAGVRRCVCQVPVQAVSQGRNRVMVKVQEDGARLAGAELWIHR